jgi:hypothetical protein
MSDTNGSLGMQNGVPNEDQDEGLNDEMLDAEAEDVVGNQNNQNNPVVVQELEIVPITELNDNELQEELVLAAANPAAPRSTPETTPHPSPVIGAFPTFFAVPPMLAHPPIPQQGNAQHAEIPNIWAQYNNFGSL